MTKGDVIEVRLIRELKPDQWLPAIIEATETGVIDARLTGSATLPGGYKRTILNPADRGNTWR